MRFRLLALALCFAHAASGTLVDAEPKPLPTDKPGTVQGQQKIDQFEIAIAPYVAKARKTYPAAKQRWQNGLPAGNQFFLVTRVYDCETHWEQSFIAVESIAGGTVKGRIASELSNVRKFKQGDAYEFPESAILDWVIVRPDGSEEGNVVGNFLDNYNP